MKRIHPKLILLLAITLLVASCVSEEAKRTIVYTVTPSKQLRDNPQSTPRTTTVHLKSDKEWDALMDRFCDLATEGASVTFFNSERSSGQSASKEVVTFSTTSREEMKAWMRQQEAAGKTVTITYDSDTRTWNGRAYANAPSRQGGTATYANVGFDGWHGDHNVIVTIDSANHTVYVNFDLLNNYWLHMPAGAFFDTYEENGRLILAVFRNDYNNPSTFDTFYIELRGGDTLLMTFAYTGACTCDHVHSCALVPVSQVQTWYCDQTGGIMHLYPNAIETYPEIHLAQFYIPIDINCISPIVTGFCEMQRFYTERPELDWELSLRYTYNNDSSYGVVDSLGLSGYDFTDAHVAMPLVIHDLHQFTGCDTQYVFRRII